MALRAALDMVAMAQAGDAMQHAGTITEADVQAMMPEAETRYEHYLAANPHPHDHLIPPALRLWAIRRIAMNLVARDLGYDVERRLRPAASTALVTPQRALALQPITRTAED